MGFLSSGKSITRKFILIGWACLVIWLYLGNLVNFHQYRIWGKQLIPIACSSTRVKDKDSVSFVKNGKSDRLFSLEQQFDFTTPDQLPFVDYLSEVVFTTFILPDAPVNKQVIQALLFRGPPSA